MAGQNLKQLLEKAKEIMQKNEQTGVFLRLEESLGDDYCWIAMSVEFDGNDINNAKEIKTTGYGQTPEEALNELIGKLSIQQNDNLWADICATTSVCDKGTPTIELPVLREILERHKILKDEKNGM